MHHGGFPRMRTFHYGYDHTTGKFDCFSTKVRRAARPAKGVGADGARLLLPPRQGTTTLSDMTTRSL
jgi:hypothetical protein